MLRHVFTVSIHLFPGPKQQKFYKNLMMNRIKWEDEIVGQKKDAQKDEEGERNEVKLVSCSTLF